MTAAHAGPCVRDVCVVARIGDEAEDHHDGRDVDTVEDGGDRARFGAGHFALLERATELVADGVGPVEDGGAAERDAFGFELGQLAHDPIGLALLVAALAHLDRRAVGVRRVNVLLGAARVGGDHCFGGGDDRAGGPEVACESDDGALAHAVLSGGRSAACEALVRRRSSEREGSFSLTLKAWKTCGCAPRNE